MGRKRRNRIDDVPSADFVELLDEQVGVGMEVESLDPHGERWEWRTFFTFNRHRSPVSYSMGSWRKPSAYEVRGRTRDEGKAWDAAREAADDARARFAAEQVRSGRKHQERVPL